ncbi:MAG: peroxide stress protein YaaA, partial [Pseudomonas graminis]
GQYKIISFYAKKARGMMTRFVISERISKPKDLAQFDAHGYRYSKELSSPDKLIFLRDEQDA